MIDKSVHNVHAKGVPYGMNGMNYMKISDNAHMQGLCQRYEQYERSHGALVLVKKKYEGYEKKYLTRLYE